MLRCFILCCLMIGGLSLSAQTTAKAACASATTQCQAKKTASTTACQAKTTSVAVVQTPAPARAANTTAQPKAVTVSQPAAKAANCNPADCTKVCEPANWEPSACLPTNCKSGTSTSTTAAAKTTIAMKQE